MSEVETAIIILSTDQSYIMRIIHEIISFREYQINQGQIKRIKDIYFDTKDDILKNDKIALRIRIINDQIFKITLKIPKQNHKTYFERIEMEKTWSQESLNQVIFELRYYMSINTYNITANYYENNPIKTLLNFGFKIIQNRETYRIIINAINKKSNQIEFEFANDNTSFIMNDGIKIQYLELEIETKKLGNEEILEKFIEDFTSHDSLFRLWPYSKLVTGIAIKYLYEHNKLVKNRDYDENNMLTLSGFEKITSICQNYNS